MEHAFYTGTPKSQLWPVSVKPEWWGLLITMVLKNTAVYRLIKNILGGKLPPLFSFIYLWVK